MLCFKNSDHNSTQHSLYQGVVITSVLKEASVLNIKILNFISQGVLQKQLGTHPLIVLKDMKFSVLRSLIEFMYCGETSIAEDNLPALLDAAKFFEVS